MFLCTWLRAPLGKVQRPPVVRSVSRFTTEDADLLLSPRQRRDLLDCFGLFGIRFAVRLIRAGATDAPALARELTAHSGLEDLRRTLHLQFGQRSTELKAHSALRSLKATLARTPSSASRSLGSAADRLLADTHVFRELRVLSGLRTSGLQLRDTAVVLFERVLGGEGMSPHTRRGPARPCSRADAQRRATRLTCSLTMLIALSGPGSRSGRRRRERRVTSSANA